MLGDNTEELAQNKLILLYIIKESPFYFSNKELNEFVLEHNYMNYFFLQQYLGELISSEFLNLVSVEDIDKYKITEKGELVLKYFNYKIPEKLIRELNDIFNEYKVIEKRKSQVVAEYYHKENINGQYVVNIKLIEGKDTLFSLYLNVGTEEQAKHVCNRWKENPDEIYTKTLKLFIDQ